MKCMWRNGQNFFIHYAAISKDITLNNQSNTRVSDRFIYEMHKNVG